MAQNVHDQVARVGAGYGEQPVTGVVQQSIWLGFQRSAATQAIGMFKRSRRKAMSRLSVEADTSNSHGRRSRVTQRPVTRHCRIFCSLSVWANGAVRILVCVAQHGPVRGGNRRLRRTPNASSKPLVHSCYTASVLAGSAMPARHGQPHTLALQRYGTARRWRSRLAGRNGTSWHGGTLSSSAPANGRSSGSNSRALRSDGVNISCPRRTA